MPTAELNPPVPAKPQGSATRGVRLQASAPDGMLVRRMREGDERSFEAIFKRHHAPLLSYCRHMLGSRDEGEDALQQVFIKAHRALLGGSAPRELRPWLYAIARNCCLTAIAARRPTAQLEDRTPALGGLSEDVHRREELRELLAGIGRLPEDQRSALLLAELEDLPHRTIATIVGCEVSKVKALIYQARSSLIADRDAREASCRDIREQLSVARGGKLRRGPIRRHLKLCEGCRDFQLAVSAQRESFAAVLPVLPSAGLLAAILGHGATHGAGAAGLGGTGGLASAGGSGATATGAGGAGGLTATGTATGTAIGTGTTVGTGAAIGTGTTVGTSAAAGTGAAIGAGGGGTSVGALIGGGLVTKLAVGGAVVAMAAAGAATVHNREGSAAQTRTIAAHLAAEAAGRSERTDIADSGAGPSGSFAQGSATALELASATVPASSAGAESLTELTVLDGANPLLSAAGTLAPSAATSAGVGQRTGTPSQGDGGAASSPRAARAARAKEIRAKHRAVLRRRHELLRRKAARLRRLRAARRRAGRKALHHKHPRVKPAVTPAVTPAPPPPRPRRRKAHPPLTPTTGATAPDGSTTTASAKVDASKAHRRSPEATPTSGNGAGATTSVETGQAGSKTGKGKAKETGSTKETGSSKVQGPGSDGETEGTSGSSPARKKTGGGATSGTGEGSADGTSGGGTSGRSGEAAADTAETTGTSNTKGTGTRAAPPKHLVEEEQLPNL
jgi:RNA polymerase sigma factor (sigma-70 family)